MVYSLQELIELISIYWEEHRYTLRAPRVFNRRHTDTNIG